MRATTESFLQFLSDNLVGIPIHAVRKDTNQPDAEKLQVNALNVSFLNPTFDVHVSELIAVLDVTNENELTALDWMESVWKLLTISAETPKLDYTNPASPVALGDLLYWPTKILFRPIHSPFYTHYHCRMPIKHRVH